MKPILRSYQNEEDFWRIRSFLRQVLLLFTPFAVKGWRIGRLSQAQTG